MEDLKKLRKKYLLKESKETRTNIENLYNARKIAFFFFLYFFDAYKSIRRQAEKGTGKKKIKRKQKKLDVNQKKEQNLEF